MNYFRRFWNWITRKKYVRLKDVLSRAEQVKIHETWDVRPIHRPDFDNPRANIRRWVAPNVRPYQPDEDVSDFWRRNTLVAEDRELSPRDTSSNYSDSSSTSCDTSSSSSGSCGCD